MKRVLSITAGLMGLWLILGVGGLAIVRARETPQPAMLVDAPDDARPDKRAIYIAGFGSRLHKKLIAGYVGYVGRGWSPDGEWFYLDSTHADDQTRWEGDVWRIHRNKDQIEYLAGMSYTPISSWTPDGKWLYSVEPVLDGTTNGLFQVKPDGSEVRYLTPNFDRGITNGFLCNMVVTRNSIYFCARSNNSDEIDLFRLHVETGEIENLTENIANPPSVAAVAEDHSWMVMRTQSGVYVTGPNGSNPQPIFDEWPRNNTIYLVTWIPSASVIVVATGPNSELWAFKMPEGRFIWHYPRVELKAVTSDGWLILHFLQRAFVRIRPEGFGLGQIVTDMSYTSFFGVTPDAQWLVYKVLNGDTNTVDLWRIPLMGGEPNHLFHVNSVEMYLNFVSWSPDQQWLLLRYGYNDMDTIMVKVDGSETRPLVAWGDAQFLDWFGPIDRDWQPFGLMGVGAVLIGVYGLVTLKKKSA